MKLLINPAGGMAGDMFAAALVSAGADPETMQKAMLSAGEKLGTAQIDIKQTADGSSQILIKLDSKRHHLGGNEAREILGELFHQFNILEKYRDFGLNILETLIKAEKRAHTEYNIIVEGDHSHPHAHNQDHYHEHHHPHQYNQHHNHHHHNHHPSEPEETFLHEAQDIVIDIIGAVIGMQHLDIEPAARLICPVSVGGGHVHFSHGTHPIPAPATTILLEEYHIEWKKGPIDVELFTPTGAAILATLGARLNTSVNIDSLTVVSTGRARGSKILDIPPFELILYSEK